MKRKVIKYGPIVLSMGLSKYVLILNQVYKLSGKGVGESREREKAYILYALENTEKYGRPLNDMCIVI